MRVTRGCRGVHAEGGSWQRHLPLPAGAALRRGTRADGYGGRGLNHLGARAARAEDLAAVGADLVAVRDAARGEDEVTGAQRRRLAGQVQRALAAEAVEALVHVAMD